MPEGNNTSLRLMDRTYLFIMLAIVSGIIASSFFNFLIFHTLAELFSVIIAYSIFIVAWNTRKYADNRYLLFLGIVYLFVGILDLTHALAYKGMNIFPGDDANLPTQLWIATRYLEAISLSAAPVFFSRRLPVGPVFLVYLGITVLLLLSLFVWPIFPDCYIEGVGLTPFKKVSEYAICSILLLAVVTLYRKRQQLEPAIFRLVIASLLLTVIAEIAFTFYISVYGISNLLGHVFKILSFYLIYQAVIVATLTMPYRTLFRELSESEQAKQAVINELQQALGQVKLLEGFLPICASCKHIRDDKGYWNQIEKYIAERADVVFSHSICPKCAKELYGEYLDDDEMDQDAPGDSGAARG